MPAGPLISAAALLCMTGGHYCVIARNDGMKNFGVCADRLIKLQPPRHRKKRPVVAVSCSRYVLQDVSAPGGTSACPLGFISLTESGLATERRRGRCRVSTVLYFPSLDVCLVVKTTLFKKLDKIILA